MGLLLMRVHMVWTFVVTANMSGVLDCFIPLLIIFVPQLFWVIFPALGVGWMAAAVLPTGRRGWARWVLCGAGFWTIPILELIRLAWPSLPRTFLEPIGLAFLTGLVVKDFVRLRLSERSTAAARRPAAWFSAVVLAALGLGIWWFWQSHQAYADYQLGYYDFGPFARRVINTWRGYGVLLQSPGMPRFWDHFNPGLVLLTPLWGLWPDVHVFFAIQASCLIVPAVFVYGIARKLGATSAGAAAWAVAYLTWPVVGQLNLNLSYGWHPDSAAIPLMLAAAYCLISGRKAAALLLAVLACSFKEDVLVTTIGLAVGLAVLAWRERKWSAQLDLGAALNPSLTGEPSPSQPSPFAWLPAPRVSLIVAAAFLAAMVTIFATMAFPHYQVSRFNALGNSSLEIALSPFLHPRAFWLQVLSSESLYYVLVLFVPFGLLNAVRGWPLQIALVVPLTVVLSWHFSNARCIAFQYITCLAIVAMWAALVGARRSATGRANPAAAMTVFGTTALATALTMSLVFGALPTTPPTSPFYVHESYRPQWDPRVKELDRLVALIDKPDASVLASGRVASHLLGVRRLEMFVDALNQKDLLAREAGPGKSWIDVFQWVLLDMTDTGQIDRHFMDETVAQFRQAGYETVYDNSEIILLRRPQQAQ
jgi:uncharacterized membrane protein